MKTLLLCVAVLVAGPALAQSGATTSSQPVAVVKADSAPEKLICKKQEVIGSLIAKKRVCATAAVWEHHRRNAKEHLEILTAPGAFAPSG